MRGSHVTVDALAVAAVVRCSAGLAGVAAGARRGGGRCEVVLAVTVRAAGGTSMERGVGAGLGVAAVAADRDRVSVVRIARGRRIVRRMAAGAVLASRDRMRRAHLLVTTTTGLVRGAANVVRLVTALAAAMRRCRGRGDHVSIGVAGLARLRAGTREVVRRVA